MAQSLLVSRTHYAYSECRCHAMWCLQWAGVLELFRITQCGEEVRCSQSELCASPVVVLYGQLRHVLCEGI